MYQVGAIVVDASHEAVVIGIVPPGAADNTENVCRLSADGSSWKWCVRLSMLTTGRSLALGPGDDVLVLGGDLLRVSKDGKVELEVGGVQIGSVGVDAGGDAWVAALSFGYHDPATVNAIQAAASGTHPFVQRVRPDGVTDFASYFGGSGYDYVYDVAGDASGDAVIVGSTSSTDLPVVNPAQATHASTSGDSSDGFVAVLRPFAARFTVPRGDDHHVWAKAEANRPVIAMDARSNGGGWEAMSLDASGFWVVAMDVAPSSAVEVRATGQGGVSVISGRLYWPYAEPFPPPGPFTVKFIHPRGSSTWVEVDVAANAVVTGAQASIGGGAWQALTQTAWGSWAAPLTVPVGATVQVRVTGADTSTIVSPAWGWPPP